MKKLISSISFLAMFISSVLSFGAAEMVREIEMKVGKIGEVTHWLPEKVEVTEGEKVKFIAKHDVPGGFDFHSFSIPVLKIEKQVDRGKPVTVEVTIPKTLKPGEYKIGCQFHAKHAPATLVVKAPGVSPAASSPVSGAEAAPAVPPKK